MAEKVPQNLIRLVPALLGQWAVWTRAAVKLLERIKRARANPAQ